MPEEQAQQRQTAQNTAVTEPAGIPAQMRSYSGILLTIGMIVRDEEKNLRRCLESLQPLREALPCELLVTDTGSSDRTAAIAAEFADEVRHIRWCDDFAAARNTTLAAANGEWFFYMDADEALDGDISGILAFFQDGLHLQYATADCIVRSEGNTAKAEETCACRFHRLQPGMRFQNRVFEQLPEAGPVFPMQTILHHDVWGDPDGRRRKNERNRRLLAMELQERPAEERLLRRMAESCSEACRTETPAEEQEKEVETVETLLGAAEKYIKAQQYDEAEQALLQKTFVEQGEDADRQQYIELILQLAAQGRRQKLVSCYQELTQAGEERWLVQFRLGFQHYLYQDEAAWAEMAQLQQEEPFTVLCRLHSADPDDRDTQYALLDYLQAMDITAEAPYQDILYWSLRLNHGMEQVIERIPAAALTEVVRQLVVMHEDFASITLQWVQQLQGSRQSLRGLHWLTELMTLTLIYSYAGNAQAAQQEKRAEKISVEVGTALFCQTAAALTLLCRRIYCGELLQLDNMDLLPKLHRMALYVEEAMRKKEGGDVLGYVQNLKLAAGEYPLLSRPIQQLDTQLQEEMDAQKQITDEFQDLAQQVKQQTAQLIALGEFQEAMKILGIYQSVNPGDQEAADMYRMLQEKQSGLGLQ